LILDKPALVLRYLVDDVVETVDKSLRSKRWTDFEISSLKLYYLPFYVFNYDVLVEQELQGQTFSQGFSGTMAMDASSGKLQPMITELLDRQPVSFEKKVSHDLKFIAVPPAIKADEAKETAARRLAGKFGVGEESVKTSGFRIIYWPVWRVFVSMPAGFYKLDVDGFSGVILNESEIPIKEKTWKDMLKETVDLMKSPKGWAVLLKKTFSVLGKTASKKGEGKGILSKPWFRWAMIFLMLAVLIYLLLGGGF